MKSLLPFLALMVGYWEASFLW